MIGLAPVSLLLLSGKQGVLMLCCHMGGNEQEGCSHRITHSNSLSTLSIPVLGLLRDASEIQLMQYL